MDQKLFTTPRLLLGVLLALVLSACGTSPETQTFDLTVTVAGDGTGNVTSAPEGIDVDAGDTSATFEEGTEVTLTATLGQDSTFEGWSGACTGTDSCVIVVDGDTEVTATFAPVVPVALGVSVVVGGSADGSVTSDPAGIAASAASESSAEFPTGDVVTLTAEATAGAFSGWVGGGCDDVKTLSCDVTMDAAKDVIATFNDPQPLVVRVGAGGDDAVEFLGDSVAGATWPESDPPTPRWFEGWVWAERANLHLGWAVYHNLAEAAFRFPALAVPDGAIVTDATLQVTSAGEEDGFSAAGEMSLTIEGELSAAPDGFVEPAVDEVSFDITDRARTSASVTWDITQAWADDTSHQAPNAASILQEIVDQPDWTTDSPIVLFLKGGSLEDQTYRRVHTFESGAPVENHPTLMVEYVVMPDLP